MLYSKHTGGFYSYAIHGDAMPSDSVEITKEYHSYLLDGQSLGKIIVSDAKGYPILQDAPDAIRNIHEEIDALERTQLMPRATREFMLLSMESQFTPAQLLQNPGYQAVKAFDNQIVALRALL